MSEFIIEKTREDVTIQFVSAERVEGAIFLNKFSAHHSGEEDMEEYFRGSDSFFPVAEESGRFSIVQKSTVVYVRYSNGEKKDESLVFKRGKISIVFPDGSSLSGEISLDMPSGQGRPLDYLNRQQGFFVLYGEFERYLVNSAMICRVLPE